MFYNKTSKLNWYAWPYLKPIITFYIVDKKVAIYQTLFNHINNRFISNLSADKVFKYTCSQSIQVWSTAANALVPNAATTDFFFFTTATTKNVKGKCTYIYIYIYI